MADPMPTVSVIIPTYNRAELVSRAIQSALDQTHPPLEIIVVDDGSTDDTKETVREFAERDSRVKYIGHETNRGVSAARNTGILSAQGEYIAFLDSDCYWLPEKIEKQLKVFKQGGSRLGAVASGAVNIGGNSPGIKIKDAPMGDVYKNLLLGFWPGGPPVMLIKKECFETVGLFDEQMPSAEDNDLYIRIAKYYHFGIVAEPLVEIDRGTPDGLSSNSAALFQGRKRILEKYEKEFPRTSPLRSQCSSYVGRVYCAQGDMKQGRRYLRQALLADPMSINKWLNLAASFFPYSMYKTIKVIRMKLK